MPKYWGFSYGRSEPTAFLWDGVRAWNSPFDVVFTEAQFKTWETANPVPVFDPETQKVILAPGPSWSVVPLETDEASKAVTEKEAKQLRAWIAAFEAGTASSLQVQRAIARLLRAL